MLSLLRDRLKTGRELILWERLDAHGKTWDIDLLYGGRISISIDSEVRPGKLKVTAQRGDYEHTLQVVKRYYRKPVYKVSMRLNCDVLLEELKQERRPVPRHSAARLKSAIRTRISTAGHRIWFEEDVDDGIVWIIHLRSAQNLRIQHFDVCRDFGLTVAGFGTDLDRLDELMIGLSAKPSELDREAIRL